MVAALVEPPVKAQNPLTSESSMFRKSNLRPRGRGPYPGSEFVQECSICASLYFHSLQCLCLMQLSTVFLAAVQSDCRIPSERAGSRSRSSSGCLACMGLCYVWLNSSSSDAFTNACSVKASIRTILCVQWKVHLCAGRWWEKTIGSSGHIWSHWLKNAGENILTVWSLSANLQQTKCLLRFRCQLSSHDVIQQKWFLSTVDLLELVSVLRGAWHVWDCATFGWIPVRLMHQRLQLEAVTDNSSSMSHITFILVLLNA